MKVLAIGEIIFDIYGGDAVIGGAPLNFCAHCAACGAESALVSAVGKDGLAQEALMRLEFFGIKTDYVESNSLPTGQCIVTVNNGIPSYDVLRPAAYDAVCANGAIEKIKAFNADVFAFGTLIQREAASRKTLERLLSECVFENIFCDVNLRNGCYDRKSCLNCLENATVLKLSDEEEPLLASFGFYKSGENEKTKLINICSEFPNIGLIIYTKGENGSLVYCKEENRFYEFDAEKTEVVSTVGAGDSYSAAFICEYFKSGDIQKAGKAGSALSAFVVANREAVPKK